MLAWYLLSVKTKTHLTSRKISSMNYLLLRRVQEEFTEPRKMVLVLSARAIHSGHIHLGNNWDKVLAWDGDAEL